MDLSNLKPAERSKFSKKRVGRGHGSGTGVQAGRGHKGAKSRSGFKFKRGFEGGQMPLHRRVPKRGFHNPFRTEYQVVGLDDFAHVSGTEVSMATLEAAGLAKASKGPAKVLANGEVKKAYTVKGLKVSAAAKAKIVATGGAVEA